MNQLSLKEGLSRGFTRSLLGYSLSIVIVTLCRSPAEAAEAPVTHLSDTAPPAVTEVAGAEAALQTEIKRLYRAAVSSFTQHDLATARNGFLDCWALYQAAEPHLANPKSLQPVTQGCQRYLELIRVADEKTASPGGLKWRLIHTDLPQGFRVRQAETGLVIGQLRNLAEEGGGKPISFTLRASAAMLERKLTLETERVSVHDALVMVCRLAGLEMSFDEYSVTFAAAPVTAGKLAEAGQ